MTFESIFASFETIKTVQLAGDKHPSIKLIDEEPFYITPSFQDISSQKDANIYVISAPGATGKSALAKHLAFQFSSIYWDLSEITLGDNSFIGTLVNSVGQANFSDYISNLAHGKTVLIIDAFDEAEMISGTKSVRTFLLEIAKFAKDASAPCIILLSRAETAQKICSFFNEVNTSYKHFEISFFEEQKAIDFITRVVEKEKTLDQNTDIISQCINQYVSNIARLVPHDELPSFIGYAPVLEVIGKHIARERNAYSFLQTLQSQSMKGIDVITKIMHELLVREHEKVKNSFLKRVESEYDCEKLETEQIYSPEEQIVCIIYYILFASYDYSVYTNSYIPFEIKDKYSEIIETFLPQHPFIKSVKAGTGFDFTGPAFRDYVLSLLISDEKYKELIQMFFDEKRVSNHFPSHLLWNFYTNNNNVDIPADKIPYLFESFRSQTKADAQAYLTIGGSAEIGYSSTWTITAKKEENTCIESYALTTLLDFCKNGCIAKWLLRLQEIDKQQLMN